VIRVIFVCFGNICRSPMAEAIFEHLLKEADLSDQIQIDSAGTSAVNTGQPAHRGTQDILLRHGIVYEGSSRKVTLTDLHQADYVVAMDADNVFNLQAMLPNSALDGKIHLLLDFAPLVPSREVPDPIYDGRFEYVYDLIEAGCRGLLDHIRAEHEL
jgi:protein-tyrosine phosphatase